MKKLTLILCLLVSTLAAHAQFEKGKWIVNPSITGLGFSYDTGLDKAAFGLEVNGGAFVMDNLAVLVHAGASWNDRSSDTDIYTLGAGGRYYFDQVGIFAGCNVNMDRWKGKGWDDTLPFENSNNRTGRLLECQRRQVEIRGEGWLRLILLDGYFKVILAILQAGAYS